MVDSNSMTYTKSQIWKLKMKGSWSVTWLPSYKVITNQMPTTKWYRGFDGSRNYCLDSNVCVVCLNTSNLFFVCKICDFLCRNKMLRSLPAHENKAAWSWRNVEFVLFCLRSCCYTLGWFISTLCHLLHLFIVWWKDFLIW